MQPRLDRRHGPPEAQRERLAAQTAVIGQQHDCAFFLVQGLKAVQQLNQSLGPFPCSERVDFIRGRLEALGQVLDGKDRRASGQEDVRAICGDLGDEAGEGVELGLGQGLQVVEHDQSRCRIQAGHQFENGIVALSGGVETSEGPAERPAP